MARPVDNPHRTAHNASTWHPVESPPQTINCGDVHKGPHNRCQHPTPAPPGYHRCQGENGCPVLIADRDPDRLCAMHADEAVAADLRPYRDLLEAP